MKRTVESRGIPHSAKFTSDRIDFGSRRRWTTRLCFASAGLVLFGAAAWSALQQKDDRWILAAAIALFFLYLTYRAAQAPKTDGRVQIIRDVVAARSTDDDSNVIIVPREVVSAVEIHYQNLNVDGVTDGEYEIRLARRGYSASLPVFTANHPKFGNLLRVAMQTADFCQARLVFHESSRKARKLHRQSWGWLLPVFVVPPLAWGLWLAARQASMLAWPTTIAVIDAFDLNAHRPGDGVSWYARPTVKYHYDVNGKQYTSDRLNPSPLNYLSKESLRDDTDGFKPGVKAPCWYRESDPAVAYIVNRGITVDVWLTILAPLAFGVIAGRRILDEKRLPALVQLAENQARQPPTTR